MDADQRQIPAHLGGAAIDQKGYWIINMKKRYDTDSREVSDYDPKRPEGAILGPLPIP